MYFWLFYIILPHFGMYSSGETFWTLGVWCKHEFLSFSPNPRAQSSKGNKDFLSNSIVIFSRYNLSIWLIISLLKERDVIASTPGTASDERTVAMAVCALDFNLQTNNSRQFTKIAQGSTWAFQILSSLRSPPV